MPEIIEPIIIEPNVDAMGPAEKRGYLAALQRALYTGVDYVSFEGNQTKFRSRADLKDTIRDLKREIGIGRKKSRVSRARMERL